MTHLKKFLLERGFNEDQIACLNNTPVTGVIDSRSIDYDLFSEIELAGINLDYETFIKENGENASEDYQADSPTILYGFKKGEDDLYDEDPTQPYSLISNGSYNTIQVSHSKYLKLGCLSCSPCYPGQADLDTDGGSLTAYSFSPEDLDEDHASDSAKTGIIHKELLFIDDVSNKDLPLHINRKWETKEGQAFFEWRFKTKETNHVD